MTKEEILNYVSKTPYNTNRAVLSGMLDAITEGEEIEDLEKYLVESITITNDNLQDYLGIKKYNQDIVSRFPHPALSF